MRWRGGTLMMTAVAAVLLVEATLDAHEVGWRFLRGEWGEANEFGRVLVCRGTDEGVALWEAPLPRGAFRCLVEPSLTMPACGITFLAARDTGRGYQCGIAGPAGGFWLTDDGGKMVWHDPTAPLDPYSAVWIEIVLERGRARVQLLAGDGTTLLSQSPWFDVPQSVARSSVGLFASGGPARFRSPAVATEPLSPVVEDPPNLRRLGNDPDWVVLGQGLWMWASGERDRIQQTRPAERAYAIHLPTQGMHRVWRTWVRVRPGAGGAGMEFLVDPARESGLLCWLGGQPGSGCLMLYSIPLGELWQGPGDTWHYDTDYLLEAETRSGEVRVRLCDAAGETLSESPWVPVPQEITDRPGHLGFQTWGGQAEFWGFMGEASSTVVVEPPDTTELGLGWHRLSGEWSVDAAARSLTLTDGEGACANRQIEGSKGIWRVTLSNADQARRASLLFQVSGDLSEGFALEVDQEGARLVDLSRPDEPRWRAAGVHLGRDAMTLEGIVETDRVRVRILVGDQVVVESPAVYVSDRNNTRRGWLGVSGDGPVRFADWVYESAE